MSLFDVTWDTLSVSSINIDSTSCLSTSKESNMNEYV